MNNNTRSHLPVFSFFAVAFLLLFTASPVLALTCRVTPENIPITLSYNGATLQVSGENNAGDDLIIQITNAPADAHYKYIGKAGGLVWMKKGDISFKDVPGVYMLYTSRDLEHLLSPTQQKTNLIGYNAIKERAKVETDDDELRQNTAFWKDEFIRFKENEKLYAVHTGTVTRQHGQSSDSYQVEIAWPYQAATGIYTVKATAVRDGIIVEQAESTFGVERQGLVRKLTDLAFNHAALYGLMAVLIAIIAGLAVGLIFKKGGGAH